MDESWGFRPLPGGGGGGGGGGVCPICYVAHFPFCPPPPPFDPLRRLPPEAHTPPFRHPFHDPPFAPHPPLTSVQFPNSMPGRPNEPWNSAHRFVPSEFFERESFHKRMRIEEPAAPVRFRGYHPPPGLISSDDARRLSLIRDHGRQDAPPFGEQRSNGVYPVDQFDLGVRSDRFPTPHPQFRHQYQNFPEARNIEGAGRFPPYERNDFEGRGDIVSNHQTRDYSYESKDLERRDFGSHKSGDFVPQASNSTYRQDGRFDGMPQDCRSSDTVGCLEHYASHDPQDRPLNDTQSLRHGDSNQRLVNYADHVTEERPFYDSQSYKHGDSTGSWRSYATHTPQEQYSYDSQCQASHPQHEYASRGPYDKYDAPNQHLHPEGSSPYGLPDQLEYPITNSCGMVPNAVNGQQDSSGPMYSLRHNEFGFHKHQHYEMTQAPPEFKPPIPEGVCRPFEHRTFLASEKNGARCGNQDKYLPVQAKNNSDNVATSMSCQVHTSHLPQQILVSSNQEPPPPCFKDSHLSSISEPPSVPNLSHSTTSASVPLPAAGYSISDPHTLSQRHSFNEHPMHVSTGFTVETLPFVHVTSSKHHMVEGAQLFPLKNYSEDKPKVIDACCIFKQPHRASRPDHIVIILRGLPGSGKSYLAKQLRDLEVENGGSAPRIHAMDDYFMIEVEKVEDNGSFKSSGSVRHKRPITKKVIEYCYEPEMEEVYRSSMLKAFKKTLDEGNFTFVIVDDRNLRVADFAQFWAIAKRSGYEVYLLEATYKDPIGCAARNVHGFAVEEIQKMADKWEEAPLFYLKLDIQSLIHGDTLNDHSIQEVDMDADDAAPCEDDTAQLRDQNDLKLTVSTSLNDGHDNDLMKDGKGLGVVEDKEELTEVKELGLSKWSKDFDEDIVSSNVANKDLCALSGLVQTYGKGDKSVHWGDRVDESGFSIGAVKKQRISSLIIGPGNGYNLKSNPLPEEENPQEVASGGNINESRKRFHEQLRAERESFKVVFDRRRQRIGGIYNDEDE